MQPCTLVLWRSFLVPAVAGVGMWEARFQQQPHSLLTTQQWHLASKEDCASSRSIPACGTPQSCPLRSSAHRQKQFSPGVCYPNLSFQHPAPASSKNEAVQRLTTRVLSREHAGHSKHFSNNTRDDTTHGHHHIVSTKIILIMLFAAKVGEALYSQENLQTKVHNTIQEAVTKTIPKKKK